MVNHKLTMVTHKLTTVNLMLTDVLRQFQGTKINLRIITEDIILTDLIQEKEVEITTSQSENRIITKLYHLHRHLVYNLEVIVNQII